LSIIVPGYAAQAEAFQDNEDFPSMWTLLLRDTRSLYRSGYDVAENRKIITFSTYTEKYHAGADVHSL
jgi:hypothetical protein